MNDFIACSDLHLRDDIPFCRKDDFFETMLLKLRFLVKQSNETECGLFIAGDIFDHWKPSPWLLGQVISIFKKAKSITAVPGQHDLPSHNMDLYKRSGLYVLERAGVLTVKSNPLVSCVGWGMEDHNPCTPILLIHKYVWMDSHFPDADPAGNYKAVLKAYKNHDVIISGDNHESFLSLQKQKGEDNPRLIINCGSMMRQSIDQRKHKPVCFRVNLSKKLPESFEEITIPHDHDVFIDTVNDTEVINRAKDFISKLKIKGHFTLDFRTNLSKALREHKISKEVEREIWKMFQKEIKE